MKYLRLLILINITLLIYSCGTIKEGFTNQKKTSSDEFLVEKKSPLVMPPNYSELPIPKEGNLETIVEDKNIKDLVTNPEKGNEKKNNSKGTNKNFEKSLLEKIQEN